MYNAIFHPLYNKWVNTTGYEGKKLLKKYIQVGGTTLMSLPASYSSTRDKSDVFDELEEELSLNKSDVFDELEEELSLNEDTFSEISNYDLEQQLKDLEAPYVTKSVKDTELYAEGQKKLKCGKHALNNLLGENKIYHDSAVTRGNAGRDKFYNTDDQLNIMAVCKEGVEMLLNIKPKISEKKPRFDIKTHCRICDTKYFNKETKIIIQSNLKQYLLRQFDIQPLDLSPTDGTKNFSDIRDVKSIKLLLFKMKKKGLNTDAKIKKFLSDSFALISNGCTPEFCSKNFTITENFKKILVTPEDLEQDCDKIQGNYSINTMSWTLQKLGFHVENIDKKHNDDLFDISEVQLGMLRYVFDDTILKLETMCENPNLLGFILNITNPNHWTALLKRKCYSSTQEEENFIYFESMSLVCPSTKTIYASQGGEYCIGSLKKLLYYNIPAKNKKCKAIIAVFKNNTSYKCQNC